MWRTARDPSSMERAESVKGFVSASQAIVLVGQTDTDRPRALNRSLNPVLVSCINAAADIEWGICVALPRRVLLSSCTSQAGR